MTANNNHQQETLAFIGLGVMGFPMAGHLSKAGYKVQVWNRTKQKGEKWLKKYPNGLVADSIKDAVKDADIVISCVGNDQDVRKVLLSNEGAFKAMKKGAIAIDHTTSSAKLAEEANKQAQELSLSFIDAPVSGGQAGAENAKLSIMCGGNIKDFQKVEKILNTYALKLSYFGKSGSGQTAKMVNQICIAGLLQALSEGIFFAQKSGLDIKLLVETLKLGAAGSWQMENRGETMAKREFDFGFALDWMHKDLKICLEEADRKGVSLPLTAMIDQLYVRLQKRGMGRCDSSSLISLLDD